MVDGLSGNGVFAASVNADDGMVVVASTAAAQLMTTTAIAAATISQRRHHCQCHCIIISPFHCHVDATIILPLSRARLTLESEILNKL